jgi:hypothetical protein
MSISGYISDLQHAGRLCSGSFNEAEPEREDRKTPGLEEGSHSRLNTITRRSASTGTSRCVRRDRRAKNSAVETLGCAQVICTDKAGSLTVGTMTAHKLVTGEGYAPEGAFFSRDYIARHAR